MNLSKMVIKIHTKAEHEAGEPLMEGVKWEDIVDCGEMTVGILEKGTKKGNTSLMFLMKDPESGKVYMGQCTANHLRGLSEALAGAEARFKEQGE